MAKILKDYPDVSLKPESISDLIDFNSLFGRAAQVHIEIGSGKGTFLVNEAGQYPDRNYLGIEWASKFYRHAVDRIGRWGIENVRMIRTEAAGFIAEFVPEGSIDCFHIYFPDPWPKKRHHKRRFFNDDNLTMLLGKLKAGGTIRIATDHAGYFDQIEEVIARAGKSIEKIDFAPAAGASEDEWVGTNFERKYKKENRPIYTAAMRKI
jgi:tRNA (guanine-N7-)-methyltransferase